MHKPLLAAAVATATVMTVGAAMAADLIMEPAAEPMIVSEAGDWYISLFAGGVWPSDVDTVYDGYIDYTVSFDPGYLIGMAVGTHVFDNVRGEVELSAGMVEANHYAYDYIGGPGEGDASGTLYTAYMLGNLWYDLSTDSSFTPYLGGGLGIGYATADTHFASNPYGYGPGGFGVAFQLGAGVKIDVTEAVALDIGYRYKSILGVDFDDSDGSGVYEDATIGSHVVQAGVTVSF